jgi:hypothetical protein
MKNNTKRPFQKQSVPDLSASDWQTVVVRPSTMAGSFVARRYRVHPAFADLIADLAGLGADLADLGSEVR